VISFAAQITNLLNPSIQELFACSKIKEGNEKEEINIQV